MGIVLRFPRKARPAAADAGATGWPALAPGDGAAVAATGEEGVVIEGAAGHAVVWVTAGRRSGMRVAIALARLRRAGPPTGAA